MQTWVGPQAAEPLKGDSLMAADSTISRRTLAKGAAWSIPAVAVASAAPAFAASGPGYRGGVCQIIRLSGDTANQLNMYVVGGFFGAPGTVLPAGSKIELRFTIVETNSSKTTNAPTPYTTTWGAWTFSTVSRATVTGSYQATTTFVATFTTNTQVTIGPGGFYCAPQLDFSASNYKPSTGVKPASNLPGASTTFEIAGTGFQGATGTSLKFNVGSYQFVSPFNRRPLSFISASGYTYLPDVQLQGGSMKSSPDVAVYCTTDNKAQWNSSNCFSNCYGNIDWKTPNYIGLDFICALSSCGPNYTNYPATGVGACTGKDCTSNGCCLNTGCDV